MSVQVKVFQPQPPRPEAVYLQLDQVGDAVFLVAVNEQGEPMPGSNVLDIDHRGIHLRGSFQGYGIAVDNGQVAINDRRDSNLRLVAGNAFTKLEEIRDEAIAYRTFGPDSGFANRLLAVINDLKAALVP